MFPSFNSRAEVQKCNSRNLYDTEICDRKNASLDVP